MSASAQGLDWLAGSWHGGNAKETWEAQFTTGAGGVVLGTYKQAARSGALSFLELQQFDLRQKPATLTLIANAGQPYRMTATQLTDALAEFTGDHAFPRTASYARGKDGSHTLTLTGTMNGKPFTEHFEFTR